jgi:hypothetical protein
LRPRVFFAETHNPTLTGRDEHGENWPLFFRAFGDYKNPVYVYLLAGLFKLTGPSILVARLLSAACVLAAALLLGLLATRLTNRDEVGLLTATGALLTPWLFETSRMVMEVALYPLALTLFLLSLHRASLKSRWSLADVARLALTLALLTYTYSIGRLLAPLLALGLIMFMTRERRLSVLQTWCAYLLTLIPLFVFNARHPGALTARFKTITYISPQDTYWQVALDFAKHFVGNLNPWRMLVSGDPNPDQVAHIFGTGHLLAATAIFALGGAWLVLRHQRQSAWWRFILYGLVVALIPASLTLEYFHMLRLIAVPVFLLVLSIPALDWLLARIKAQRMWRAVFVSLIALTLLQGAVFQWRFHRSASTARRLHLFDAEYRRAIFAPALESSSRPIYLADAVWIPGYIQAYWYATLEGINLSQFVLLPPSESPPVGATVITTEGNCPRCQVLAKSEPYTLYVANAPARRREPMPDEGFRAELYPPLAPAQLRAREKETIRVRVKNTSGVVWLAQERSGGHYQVSLGNHWLDAEGKMIVGDDGRSPLLADLAPGEETELSLTVNAPRQRGDYILEIDMLQETVAWFGTKGSTTAKVRVRVE